MLFQDEKTKVRVTRLLMAWLVKNPPDSAGDAEDSGLIPGLGRSLEEGMVTLFNVLAWEVQWTEEPGGPQSMGSQRV